MTDRADWEGTASALLPLLTGVISEQAAREKSWPKRADVLSGKLRRVAPALRRTGIHIAFDRTGHTRTIHIEGRAAPEQQGKTASRASQASPSGRNASKNNGQGHDANDANDAVLHPQSGNRLTSDFDAVLEELAAGGGVKLTAARMTDGVME